MLCWGKAGDVSASPRRPRAGHVSIPGNPEPVLSEGPGASVPHAGTVSAGFNPAEAAPG